MANQHVRTRLSGLIQQLVKFPGQPPGGPRQRTRLAFTVPGAVIETHPHCPGKSGLDVTPFQRSGAQRGVNHHRRTAASAAIQEERVAAEIDQSPGVIDIPMPLQRLGFRQE
jgi:hypothetical protein